MSLWASLPALLRARSSIAPCLAGFLQHPLMLPKTAMGSLCPCSVLLKTRLGARHWLVLPWLQSTVGAGWSLHSSTLTLPIEPCKVLSSLQKEAYFQPLLPPAASLPFQEDTEKICLLSLGTVMSRQPREILSSLSSRLSLGMGPKEAPEERLTTHSENVCIRLSGTYQCVAYVPQS